MLAVRRPRATVVETADRQADVFFAAFHQVLEEQSVRLRDEYPDVFAEADRINARRERWTTRPPAFDFKHATECVWCGDQFLPADVRPRKIPACSADCRRRYVRWSKGRRCAENKLS